MKVWLEDDLLLHMGDFAKRSMLWGKWGEEAANIGDSEMLSHDFPDI